MVHENVKAIEAADVEVLNENLTRSSHRIGSWGSQTILRTLIAPNAAGRPCGVHVQPRGGDSNDGETFATRVTRVMEVGSHWQSQVLITRADASTGWSVDLYIDALWVTK